MPKFEILITQKAKSFIDGLEKKRRARIDRYFELFREYGTSLPGRYLKKISETVWELRPGDVRVFLGMDGSKGIVVHAIKKKSQKLPRRDIVTAEKRFLRVIKDE